MIKSIEYPKPAKQTQEVALFRISGMIQKNIISDGYYL